MASSSLMIWEDTDTILVVKSQPVHPTCSNAADQTLSATARLSPHPAASAYNLARSFLFLAKAAKRSAFALLHSGNVERKQPR
jgi:hypothetical protein